MNAVAINAKAHEMPISKGPTPPYACAEGGIMLKLRGYCTRSEQHRMQRIIKTTEARRFMHRLIRLSECCGAVSSAVDVEEANGTAIKFLLITRNAIHLCFHELVILQTSISLSDFNHRSP